MSSLRALTIPNLQRDSDLLALLALLKEGNLPPSARAPNVLQPRFSHGCAPRSARRYSGLLPRVERSRPLRQPALIASLIACTIQILRTKHLREYGLARSGLLFSKEF